LSTGRVERTKRSEYKSSNDNNIFSVKESYNEEVLV
jgi:hypothetical protein